MKGISVIICTYNGVNRLKPVLEAIENQATNFLTELILVDNGSTDGTSAFVEKQLQDSNLNWRLIAEPNPGLSFARLAGIRASTQDYLLFCDDDNALFPNYLQKGLTLLEANRQIGVLGGEGIPQFSSLKPDWFDTYQSSYAVGPQGSESGKVSDERGFVYGAGAFFRKSPLLEIFDSGFQPYFTGRKQDQLVAGDDVEMCYLMRLKGFEIWFDPGLLFHHFIPEKRLSWEYYLQMKTGISAGAGVFFAYNHFFRNKKSTKFDFTFSYFQKLVFHQLILLKNSILMGMNPKDRNKQLAIKILKAKADSFRSDFRSSFTLFNQLKSKF